MTTNQAQVSESTKPKKFEDVLSKYNMKTDGRGQLIAHIFGEDHIMQATPASVKNVQREFGSLYKLEEEFNGDVKLERLALFVECVCDSGKTTEEIEFEVIKKGYQFFVLVASLWVLSISLSGTEGTKKGK